jgi:hypothetical protein
MRMCLPHRHYTLCTSAPSPPVTNHVKLEPTTLRLTAIEFADPPAAIGCYNPLYKIRLRPGRKLLTAVHTAWIATDFE